MRILTVFGTRPEAIKLAVLVKKLKHTPGVESKVCVTAQHREMLDSVLTLFDIKPDYDLDIMKPGQQLEHITIAVLEGVLKVCREFRPHQVIVHGDTTTTFAASLAAFYEKIPVAHVEAGLRTGKLYSPFPEELNRKLTDQISSLLFAPTQSAAENLLKEGIPEAHITITGNTVIDALLEVVKTLSENPTPLKEMMPELGALNENLPWILVTGHRRENFGGGLKNLCEALARIASRENVQIIYPLHRNPNVLQPVTNFLGKYPRIFLIDPLGYRNFVYLMSKSHMIITDSGGIQEEAPALGKPVLVTRECTERPEGVAAGTVRMVGNDPDRIVSEAVRLLEDSSYYQQLCKKHHPYGEGQASDRILQTILQQKLSR